MNYRSKYTGAEIESALDKIINNVTDNDELATIIGNVNKRFDNYLPLTGGILYNSSTDTPLKIRGNDTGAFIAFASVSEYFGYIGAKSDKKPYFYISGKSYEILTSAGGILDGSLQIGKDDNTAYNSLLIASNGKKLELTATNSTGVLFYNGAGFVFNETTASWNDNTLIHSGNVGDYALKYQGVSLPDNIKSGFGYNSDPSGYPHTGGFATFGNGIYGFQIMGYAGEAKLAARGLNNGTWTDWKTIAFKDSNITGNAASATKLQTARTIWGRSFDGTGDVSGVLKLGYSLITGGSNENAFELASDALTVGYGYRSQLTTIYGGTLRFAREDAISMIINSSSNVTIGASDLATSNYKLYVDGVTATHGLYIEHLNGKTSDYGAFLLQYHSPVSNNALVLTTRNTEGNLKGYALSVNYDTGNVIIGGYTDNGSSAKLQVAGDISMNGTSLTDKLAELEQRLVALGG